MFSACVFYLNIFLYACSKCIILSITDCIIKHKHNYAELFWMFVWFFEQLTKEENNNGCLVNLLHFLHFTQYHLKYCIFWLYRSTRPFEALSWDFTYLLYSSWVQNPYHFVLSEFDTEKSVIIVSNNWHSQNYV